MENSTPQQRLASTLRRVKDALRGAMLVQQLTRHREALEGDVDIMVAAQALVPADGPDGQRKVVESQAAMIVALLERDNPPAVAMLLAVAVERLAAQSRAAAESASSGRGRAHDAER